MQLLLVIEYQQKICFNTQNTILELWLYTPRILDNRRVLITIKKKMAALKKNHQKAMMRKAKEELTIYLTLLALNLTVKDLKANPNHLKNRQQTTNNLLNNNF